MSQPLNNNNEAFIKMWGKERTRGRVRYILVNALIFFVLLNIVTAVLNYRSLQAGDYSWFWDLRRLGTYLVASVLIVLFRWRRNERLYKLFTKEEDA